MKILLLLIFSTIAYATPNICIDATTVPAAFTDGGAAILTGIRPEPANFQIVNVSDADMCYCWGVSAAADCPAIGMMCVPPNASFSRAERPGSVIWAHHDGGAATVGKICSGAF